MVRGLAVQPYFLPGIAPQEYASAEYGTGRERVELRLPVATPSLLSAVALVITQARDTYLATLPVSRIVDVIDGAITRWLDPAYPLRQVAEELLPAITGYSRPMLRRGLPDLLRPFRRRGLLALLKGELGQSRKVKARAIGPRLTTHILAGNIPAVPVESLVHALLVKSASLVKTASGDPLFPALFAQSLAEVDPRLAASIAVLWWKGGQGGLERRAVDASDAVIAYGGDAAIESIRTLLPSHARFIAYGHRVSFAAIGRESLSQAALHRLAARAAWDVSFFDQQGCVAPHAIYVERGGEVSPLEFAQALAWEMERLERRLPRGRLMAAEAAAIQQARGAWELRQATGQPVALFQSPGSTSWTVAYEEDVGFQPSCLNRVVRVLPVDDLLQLPAILEPGRPFLQTVGLAVSKDRLAGLAANLARVGVSRVCPIGRMQHPPARWRHDGRPNLLDLLRWVEVEGLSLSIANDGEGHP